MLFRDAHTLVRLGLGNDSTLNLDLVLTVGRRLVAQTGFKWLSRVQPVTSEIGWRDIPLSNRVTF